MGCDIWGHVGVGEETCVLRLVLRLVCDEPRVMRLATRLVCVRVCEETCLDADDEEE